MLQESRLNETGLDGDDYVHPRLNWLVFITLYHVQSALLLLHLHCVQGSPLPYKRCTINLPHAWMSPMSAGRA